MLAIGSLLQVMRRNYKEPRTDGVRPYIWGSGLLHAIQPDFLENVRVCLLRGPVTAAILKIKTDRFGDPALLTPMILGDLPEKRDRVGLMVHHSQHDDPAIEALVASEPALELIDVADDAKGICRKIASCAHLVASSLHGLVVADACGVSSTWLDPGTQSRLKYIDYAASVGRPMIAPITFADVPGLLRRLKDSAGLAWEDGLDRARANLLDTFPTALRGEP